MKQLDPKRLARQQESFELWKKAGAKGSVIFPTGGGKTQVALIAIQALNKADSSFSIIIVVPTQSLKSQWEKLLLSEGCLNCKVYVVNTIALKDNIYHCDLLIADEAHRLAKSEKFPRTFELVKYKWVLGLSATIDEACLPVINKYCPVIDEMLLSEALDNNYISKYKVYNLGIDLSYSDCKKLDEWQQEYYAQIATFGDYDSYRNFLKDKAFRTELSTNLGISIGEMFGVAKRITNVVAERKNFFYNHPAKESITRDILEIFPSKKAITFSLSIEFMNNLEDETSILCHSKMKKKEAKIAMEKFTNNKDNIRCVHSGKKLLEGIDIGGLELGIRCSYTSSQVDAKQALGRIIRKEGDKEAIFINLYMNDPRGKKSIEQGWLESSMRGNNLNTKWIKSLNQIK